MRNIERFPSKQMYPYLSLVERKEAEFYYNIDRRSWLVWVKMTYFHRFFRTIPGVLKRTRVIQSSLKLASDISQNCRFHFMHIIYWWKWVASTWKPNKTGTQQSTLFRSSRTDLLKDYNFSANILEIKYAENQTAFKDTWDFKHASREKSYLWYFFYFRAQKCI